MSDWSAGRIARWAVVVFVIGGFLWMRFKPREEFELRWARDKKTAAGLVDYVDQGGNPGKVRGDLKKYHAVAKQKLAAAGAKPDAPMYALLDAMLAVVENRLVLDMPAAMVKTDRASFDAVAALMAEPGSFVAPIAKHLDEPGYDCAKGVAVVFKEALGSDVVDVEIARFIDDPDRGRPVLTIGWTARAGTSAYARANGKRIYPSFTAQAEMTLRAGDKVIASVKADAKPAADIQYTSYGIMPAMDLMYPDSDSSDSEVYGGIVASTCEALGRQLMANLTGVAATAPAAEEGGVAHDEKWCNDHNDASSCARLGVRYRDGDGVPVDQAKAAALLHKACTDGLGAAAEACAPSAALAQSIAVAAGKSPDDARAEGAYDLTEGCSYHAVDSCLALGDLRSTPSASESKVSEYALQAAWMAYLHACDLGKPEACHLASLLLAPTSPLRAWLLAKRACAGGVSEACTNEKTLAKKAAAERKVHDIDLPKGDQPFDIHWATLFDGDETDVIWIATKDAPAALEDRLRLGIYNGTVLVNPAGRSLPAPDGTTSTYLVGAKPTADYHQKCPPCPHGSMGLSLMRCTCLP